MTETTHAYDFQGRNVIDRSGEKIGKIEELYTDLEGGQPEWALVHTGLFGTQKTFVPIRGASPVGEDLQVQIDKDAVKDAPRIDAEGELSEEEERRLFEHYSVQYTTEGTTTEQGGTATAQGHTRPGRGDSDEQLGTAAEQGHTRPGRGVRLRKYVVTDDQGAG
jgi:sporulation protein YlmC with PRC-barrel domain